MNAKVNELLHEINKYRDQINCCYSCLVQDIKTGSEPLVEDIEDLKQATHEFSHLIENLFHQIKDVQHESNK